MTTEHFTREDVIASGGIVHRDGNLFFTNLDKLNAMLTAKVKEWEAQGAVAWLIEQNLPHLPAEWFIGGPINSVEFSSDPSKPMRFSRRQDAQSMLDWLRCNNKLLCVESNIESFYRVTEHMWIGAQAEPSSTFTDTQVESALKAAHMRVTKESRKDMLRALEAVIHALSRAQAAPAVGVPDGYVLVPVEPTEEMLKSAVMERHGTATYRAVSKKGCKAMEEEAKADWAAMLASAQPQQKEGA